MIINPEKQDSKDNYKLMISCILPRPIAFVSTISASGKPNLAPFSFFTGITSSPPTVCFAPARRSDGGKKDTLNNIEETGQFVINVVTEDIAGPMNETATDYPSEIDEFEKAGLTHAASLSVKPPRVMESPVNMECELYKTFDISHEGTVKGTLVIGKVVLFHVADELLEDGRIDIEQLKPIGRLAGTEYTTLGRRFSMKINKYRQQ